MLPAWDPSRPAVLPIAGDVPPGPGDLPPWQRDLHIPVHPERERVLGQVLAGPLLPDMVGFAWGAGDPRLIPMAEFRHSLLSVLDLDGPQQLGPEGGASYPSVRSWLAAYLRQHGLSVTPEELIITGSTQQTISLIAATLLKPGDRVVVEVPTWPGALEAFKTAEATVVGIALDREGLRLDRLAAALEQETPKLIYTVPTFHNPTGVVMSARRRHALCALAERPGVPVLEDDHVREVRFGNPLPPPLAAFDRHGNVIHAGSFPKSLIPSLRMGYVVVRGPLREALLSRKRTTDLFGSALMQRSLAAYLESGAVARHWRHVSRVYGRRRPAMIRALEEHVPPGARWSGVSGRLVLWVRAPDGVSVAALHETALAASVGFARGAAFFPEPTDQPFLRLNFAAIEEPEIARGIAVLGRLMQQMQPAAGISPPVIRDHVPR